MKASAKSAKIPSNVPKSQSTRSQRHSNVKKTFTSTTSTASQAKSASASGLFDAFPPVLVSALMWLVPLVIVTGLLIWFIRRRWPGHRKASAVCWGIGITAVILSFIVINTIFADETHSKSPNTTFLMVRSRINLIRSQEWYLGLVITMVVSFVGTYCYIMIPDSVSRDTGIWTGRILLSGLFLFLWMYPEPLNLLPMFKHMFWPQDLWYTLFWVSVVPPLALLWTVRHSQSNQVQVQGNPPRGIDTFENLFKYMLDASVPMLGKIGVGIASQLLKKPADKFLGFFGGNPFNYQVPQFRGSQGRIANLLSGRNAVFPTPEIPLATWLDMFQRLLWISLVLPSFIPSTTGGFQVLLSVLALAFLEGDFSTTSLLSNAVLIAFQWSSVGSNKAGFATATILLNILLDFGANFLSVITQSQGSTHELIYCSLTFMGIYLALLPAL